MTKANDIIDETLAQFPLPAEVFPQGEIFWLTLYLFGDLASYIDSAPALVADGWKNLFSSDDYGGFCYPKKAVRNDTGQVRQVLKSVLEICARTGVDIIAIDADTALEPPTSKFRTLYQRMS